MNTETAKETAKMSEILAKMFVESTGTHMLDSGGAYGRAWQRNRAECGAQTPEKWLESLPEAKIWDVDWIGRPRYKWIGVQVNTYHHLKSCTSPREDLTAGFLAWCDTQGDDTYTNCAGSIEAWILEGCPMVQEDAECPECHGERVISADGEDDTECLHCEGKGTVSDFLPTFNPDDIGTPWDRGSGRVCVGNTYNGESCLSQDFMYAVFHVDGQDYAAISIHNGADARGGYTNFVIFETDDNCGSDVLDIARCGLYTNDGDAHFSWYSDDAGHHWYPSNDEPQIADLPWTECAHKPRIRKGRTTSDRIVITREPNYGQYHVYLVYENEVYELQAGRF